MVPDDVTKPSGPREKEKPAQQTVPSEMSEILRITSVPMPGDRPDAILDTIKEPWARLQYEAEISYLRGDFSNAMRCYKAVDENDAVRVRAALVGVAAAISLGDYRAYSEIEIYLKDIIRANPGSDLAAVAELALASVAVSVIAPNMVPEWLKKGDFGAFPKEAGPPYLLYLRSRYFLCVCQYETALCLAQSALLFSRRDEGVTLTGIYLRMVCALACYNLDREEEARRRLSEAMRIALPHGFVTPFAEAVSDLGGMVEQCLELEFPEYRDAVVVQWSRTVRNWIEFHNRFTKDNITLILTLREYQISMMVSRHVPYAKIANHFNISVGRLKNIMLEIYQKLLVSGRDELKKYILLSKKKEAWADLPGETS
jgi:DNA-binding CsgD family transcriptional regulator